MREFRDDPAKLSEIHKKAMDINMILMKESLKPTTGAPFFAAMSFLRAGGGLSYLATVKDIIPSIATRGSEIIFLPMEQTNEGSISCANLDFLLEFSKKMDMVVVGPGVSLNQETVRLVKELAARIQKPLILDGDGLTAISDEPEILKIREFPTILTPHPGEMARLLKKDIEEIRRNKIEILQEACKTWNAYIVLKGAHSLIGYPDGRVFINLSGNPGMATAGSGDVLTGTIAAMHTAYRMDTGKALQMGVFIHGFAGDLAAKKHGQDGIVARDILESLPQAILSYRQEFEQIKENYYGKIFIV
jgi:NAD(P)H-hydrate epimerase